MGDQAKAIAQKIIQLISVLKTIPTTNFAQRLHYKASRSRRALEFKEHGSLDLGSPWPDNDPSPGSTLLAEFPVATPLARLADVSVARAIRDNDNQFKGKVDFAASDEVYGENMTKLAYVCYLEHMDLTLKERQIVVGEESIKNFRGLRTACAKEKIPIGDFMKTEFTKSNFVAKTIQDDIIQGDNLRSMSLLFITDFLCRDPYAEMYPHMDAEFVFKPSFEMLTAWSRTLWDVRGKGSKEQTKKIVVFCGRLATSVYCPDSVLGASSTYDTTMGLYKHIIEKTQDGDHQYKSELREALEGLVRDDLDAWKSIQRDFTGTWWVAQFPLWNDAVKKELSKDNGRKIDDWIKDGYIWENEICPPNRRILKLSQVGNGAFLLAGTHVTLADGTTRQAEQLQQGDRLLSLAKPQGVSELAQDMWPMEVTAPLVGFNGEEPFATTAQVFHTTTGIRAVNPRAAMRQNPWLRVGRLAVGHVLYRHLNSAHDYEAVEVKSIEKTAPVTRTGYSLRLSKGKRLHHQNGYLVNVNEPEIRVQDVATLLGRFTSKEQMALLSSVKEARSMLLAYGPQVVWERLQMELSDYKKASKQPWPSALEFPLFASHADSRPQKPLSHLTQRFQLQPMSSKQNLPIRKLPQATLVDGVLLLDGVAQPRVAINDDDRIVSWTRKIQGKDIFEHGRLEVHATDNGGVGTLFYSSKSDPRSFKDGQIVKANAVLSGTSAIDAASPGTEAQYYSLASGGGSSSSGLTSKWALTLDKIAWPKGEQRLTPKTPVTLDVMLTGTETIPEGIHANFVQIPLLDDLLAAINKDLKSKSQPTIEGDLYRSHLEFVPGTDEDNHPIRVTRTYVTFTQASLVLSFSDQGPASTSVFDLTFKTSLGIDLKLPALFQSFYIDTDAFAEKATGALYELDPVKREAKGERHLVVAEYQDDDSVQALQRDRAFASQSLTTHATVGLSPEHDPQRQPAAMTVFLGVQAEVTVEKLYQMIYSADDVHSLAQTTINEMMYYHMDATQLKDFTNRQKPDHLPAELTTQLSENLQKWLKNTYAPAFIARNVSQIEKFTDRFQSGEIEKVWYWWAGNGDKCLAHAKEYTQLNTIASAYAMKKKYPILEMEPAKASELAAKLYKAIKAKRVMKDVLQQPDNGTQINRLCIIMHTLDPTKTYAHDWFRQIVKYAVDAHLELPFLKDDDEKYVEEWLRDAMRELIVKVLSNDSSITGNVQKKLQEELVEYMTKTGIDLTGTVQKKADDIVQKMSVFTTEIGKLLVVVGNGLARASGVKRLFGLARDLVDKVASKVGDFGQKLARGLGCLTVISYFVGMVLPLVGVIKDWKNLTPAQRATGILETLRGVVGAADKGFEMWQKYKSAETPQRELAVSEMILDEHLSTYITGPGGERIVNLGDDLHHGEGGLEMVMAERTARDRSASSEMVPDDREVWNEERTKTPSTVTPNEEQTASKLSATSKWLRGASIVLGLAVSAAMTYSLVQDWDKLTDPGKVINTLSVIVQILSVVVEVADLLISTGILVSATLSVVIPVIGAVLAIIGIVLMIVTLFVDMYKTEPQPDPVGDFVKNVARPVITPWSDPAPSKLTYSLNTTSVAASSTATVTITGKSTTADVSLAHAQMSVWTGQSNECLFAEENFYLPEDAAKTGGRVTLTPVSLAKPTLQFTQLGEKDPNRFRVYNLWASGVKSTDNKMGSLNISKGKDFQGSFQGKINKAGKSMIEIVETTLDGFKAHTVLSIKRA